MKLRKAQKRLDQRIKEYQEMCSRSQTNGKEYRKPGSMSGKK
jgi:hypothetical protein